MNAPDLPEALQQAHDQNGVSRRTAPFFLVSCSCPGCWKWPACPRGQPQPQQVWPGLWACVASAGAVLLRALSWGALRLVGKATENNGLLEAVLTDAVLEQREQNRGTRP